MSDVRLFRLGIWLQTRISDPGEKRLIEIDVPAETRYGAVDLLRAALQRLVEAEAALAPSDERQETKR